MADLTQEEWVEQLASDSNAVILDVRTDDEVDQGFIANSKHIDFYLGQEFVNKVDARRMEVRARLVAQETRRASSLSADNPAATFAATPQLEGLKLLLSVLMTGPRRNPDDELVFAHMDISRAHFRSKARRLLIIRVPIEDSERHSKYAKLLKNYVWYAGRSELL